MESDRGYDESLWQLLCEQVGAAALVIPEELGGAGGELADAATVLQELGRALVPSPLLGTTLAELALLAAPEPDAETSHRWRRWRGHLDRRAGARPRLRGQRRYRRCRRRRRPNGQLSQLDPLQRAARRHHGPDPPAGPGATRRHRGAAGTDPGIADCAAILLAAEQIGAAERCLELTVEYAKSRVQFGRPIGSFQALKHRMADLYVAIAAARAVVDDACDDPTPTNAATARLAASEALCTVAAEGIQLHGGIAITWEHDMHLYFKRAHGSAQLLHSPRELLRQLESEVLSIEARHFVNGHVALRAGIPPFHVMDVWLAAAERQRSHGDLVNLSAGQPSVGAPNRCARRRQQPCSANELGYTVALGIPGAASRDRRGLPTPAWHRCRVRRGGGHHWLLGRVPAGFPGLLRRRRPGGDGQSRATRAIETSCRRWDARWWRSNADPRPGFSPPPRCWPSSTRRCGASSSPARPIPPERSYHRPSWRRSRRGVRPPECG